MGHNVLCGLLVDKRTASVRNFTCRETWKTAFLARKINHLDRVSAVI